MTKIRNEQITSEAATVGQALVADGSGGSAWDDVSGGGGGDFVDLGDVPAAYTDEATNVVAVNAAEDGLEFLEVANVPTATTYEIGTTDLTTGLGASMTASSSYSGYGPERAVDNNSGTDWANQSGNPIGWLKVDLGSGNDVMVGQYTIARASQDGGGSYFTEWKLQGSNDDSAWTDLDSRTGESFSSPGQVRSFDVTNPESYGTFRYFRIYITARSGWVQTSEIQLFEYIGTEVGGVGVFDSIASGQILLKRVASTDASVDVSDIDGTIDLIAKPVLQALFTKAGTLSTGDQQLRIYNNHGATKTISKVFLSVGTAPTGATIIVDIHKNGTTIFTTQSNRPVIAASAFTGSSTTIEVASWADGDYLVAHIDQVGSTIAGSDLTVHVVYS